MKMKHTLLVAAFLVSTFASAQKKEFETARSLMFKETAKAYRICEQILEGNGTAYYKSKAYSLMGSMDVRMGKQVRAYLEFTNAQELLFESDTLDHYAEYSNYQNMALIAFNSASYLESVELYDKAALAADRYVENFAEIAKHYGEKYLPNLMRFYKGNALYDAARLDEALAVYTGLDDLLIDNDGTVEDLKTFALLRNEYGLNAKGIEDWDNAMYYFRSIVEMEGVSSYYKGPALHNTALVLKEMNLADSALAVFDKAIVAMPTDGLKFTSLTDKAELLIDLKRNEEAAEALEQALALNIDVSESLKRIGVYYLAEKANAQLNEEVSFSYGKKYKEAIDAFIEKQAALEKAKNQRVFALGLAEANHLRKIERMEELELMKRITMLAQWVGVASILMFWMGAYLKEKRRRLKARDIAEA